MYFIFLNILQITTSFKYGNEQFYITFHNSPFEPHHEKTKAQISCATDQADQCPFSGWLANDNLFSKSESSSLYLASVAEQAPVAQVAEHPLRDQEFVGLIPGRPYHRH